MLNRKDHLAAVSKLLKNNPAVAILGPRQCGKTTLASQFKTSLRFDLENPEDLLALDHPAQALKDITGLILIDEIQRRPDLFPVLRFLIDKKKRSRFLILGSASRDLIRQSSESLAGRIAYYPMSGFSLAEIKVQNADTLWIRGGFPRSFLAASISDSMQWRRDYVQTFLEKDIPQLGIRIPATTLHRFWNMLAHYNGQILNCSEIGKNFEINDKTVRHYIDLLAGTFMVECIQPWFANIGKRQVKSPKFYFRDSGIFHHFLRIQTKKDLISHPKLGASWETFVLQELRQYNRGEIYFWRTQAGAEMDFLVETSKGLIGLEAKFGDAPGITPSIRSAMHDLDLKHVYVVYPGQKRIPLAPKVDVIPIHQIKELTLG